MDLTRFAIAFLCFGLVTAIVAAAPTKRPKFRILVVASKAKDHVQMMTAAEPALQKLAEANNFKVDFTYDDSVITDDNLKHYQVFVMLQLAPFDMKPSEQAALQKFIEQGHGWVGIHAAGLTGREFLDPKSVYWEWFEGFMGGVLYSPHPHFQRGDVVIEDHNHPITKGLPDRFTIGDEWYEFNKSPRGAVHVLATADESTYKPNHPMGDHPIIWTNEKFHRMVYISVGHSPECFANEAYMRLLTNAIFWAAEK